MKPLTRVARKKAHATQRGIVYLIVAFPVGVAIGRVLRHVLHRGGGIA